MLSTDKQTDKQTNRQTDKLTNATKNITSFAKEVIIECIGKKLIKKKCHTYINIQKIVAHLVFLIQKCFLPQLFLYHGLLVSDHWSMMYLRPTPPIQLSETTTTPTTTKTVMLVHMKS